MSWLSDVVRATTGSGIGENVGGFVGGVVSGGNPAAVAAGRRIGGGITEAIDTDRTSQGQATARDISPNLPGEYSDSGQRTDITISGMGGGMAQGATTDAYAGLLVPGVNMARNIVRNIPGATGVGVGAAATAAFDYVIDMFGQPKKLVITRKMKREVMELYHYLNMDMNAVARAYSQYKGMSFTPQQIQKILLKKFRNDGAYVTKAAIRKTRSTVRKLERLEALKKQITGTRAAPRRRAAATTRITQVK